MKEVQSLKVPSEGTVVLSFKFYLNERIPKLKIASLNPVFLIINRVSDHEKQF